MLSRVIIKRCIYIIIGIAVWMGILAGVMALTGQFAPQNSVSIPQKGEEYAPAVPDLPVFNANDVLKEYSTEDIIGMSYEASISELMEMLEAGAFTSQELTSYYLERIEQYNSKFNCFITFCDDALEVARLRDEQRARGEILGKLHGIPIVVKDNIDVEGYPTTNGEIWRKKHLAKDNANVVQKMLEAGAIIIGKTNMSTAANFAEHSISDVQGETKNAYSYAHSSGGSSGGSAVSVSLNFSAAALGTDTNSSLRIPAAFSGTVSMRTTYKLIDKDGVVPLDPSRDVVGAITRTVEDQALMLDVLTDDEYNFYDNLDANYLEGARIGYLVQLCELTPNFPYKRSAVNNEILEAVQQAVSDMEKAGATVVRINMPNLFYNNSKRAYSAISADLKKAFKEYDLDGLIFPSCLSTTPSSGFDSTGEPLASKGAFINPVRYFSSPLGIPEISVPMGYTSDGLSIGLEIVGLKNTEQTLLNIAYSYEQATNHRVPSPLAPNLYQYDASDIDRYLFLLRQKNGDLFV